MIRGLVNTFNRGEVDQRALGREDVKRVSSSASSMVNFVPFRLGGMIYRGGSEWIATLNTIYAHKMVPFVAAIDDTAVVDFYNDKVEFTANDVPVTVNAVATTIANGTFTTDIASWVDASDGALTHAWHDYGTGDGALDLTGNGGQSAGSTQTFGSTATGSEHFLRIVVDRAPVKVLLGTSGAGSFDLHSGTLKPGTHILVVTPGAALTVTFKNAKKYAALINSVSLDTGSANMVIDTPLTSATLDSLRYVQSGDIIFCAFDGGKPFQIERRGTKSWSVVDFRADDGPFDSINNTNITLTPGALNGDTTLTASDDLFQSDHMGALFKVASVGQQVSATLSDDNGVVTSSIRVTGVGTSRNFLRTISGSTSVASIVTLQRSADDTSWVDVTTETGNVTDQPFNDGFDNAIFYYRYNIKAGDNPTPDPMVITLDYDSGSIDGICRVTKYTSTTIVDVQVLSDFGGTDATLDWYEGSWSAANKFPASVELTEGRLFFGGDEEIWGSVSDSYYSFDRTIVGDSSSILRTIGFGPSDAIKWIKASDIVVAGTTGDEVTLRSSSYGEYLTQDNANIKSGSTQGSANVEPVKVDGTIYFVQRSGVKLMSLSTSIDSNTFATIDATLLNQDICAAGIHRIAVARQPETRLFLVMDDGTVAIFTADVYEEVAGWSRYETANGGLIKDVIVLPSTSEDSVYFVVDRGSYTYLEKLAKFKNAVGGTVSETFDGFLRYTSPGTTITGLDIHEGETVGVWADGQDRGTYTVASNQITVASSWTDVIVGLPYVADYVTSKVTNYDQYTAATERKRIVDTGLVLTDYWPGSLKVGPTVALLKQMPGIEDGTDVDATVTNTDYSELPFEFDGETESDPRIYMRATGPVTVLALSYGIDGERAYKASDT
jgi:hypothetical protein